ncbi:MAG: PAS domain-containing sensor histidine kinase, partial [Chloroflexota bacterium]|nr:PAS domain-containing sensor histidine kinase [Chloroflexota bacterium]
MWLTAFRTVATTLMLSAIALRQLSTRPLTPLSVEDQASYIVIGAVYLLTLVYALILRRGEARPRHAYVQILGDVVLATALVFLTGGADSPFTFTYSLAVVYGAILLFGRGAFFAAAASTVAFAVLLTFMRWNPPEGGVAVSPARLLFTLASNTLAQFLIAALASYLGRLLSTAGGALVAREEDLKKLGALQRQILSAMPSGLMTCSSAGTVTFINRAGAAILELREEEQNLEMRAVLPGVNWGELDGLRREVSVPSRSGPKILGLTVSPLEGPRGTALIVFQDLTKLRQMEGELRRADQLAALGRMSAQLAHEIRNPLASMRGSAQMLAEEFREGPQARLARILIRESDRLADLVESFLN